LWQDISFSGQMFADVIVQAFAVAQITESKLFCVGDCASDSVHSRHLRWDFSSPPKNAHAKQKIGDTTLSLVTRAYGISITVFSLLQK